MWTDNSQRRNILNNEVVAKRCHAGGFNNGLQKILPRKIWTRSQSTFHLRFQFALSNEENKYSQNPSVDCKLINSKSLLNNLGYIF